MNHTPEPWEVTDLRYIRQSNEPRHVVARASKMDGMDANARRIVACVNACATMPTDDLEEMVSVGGNIRNLAEFADELRKQRDELLAALTGLVEDLEMRAVDGVVLCGRSAYAKAKSALTGKPMAEYFL